MNPDADDTDPAKSEPEEEPERQQFRVFVPPFGRSETQLACHIPAEVKHLVITIRMRCCTFVDFILGTVNKTVYTTQPSPKFMSLVGLLSQKPRPTTLFYSVLRHLGAVVQDPNSNFAEVLDLSLFIRYTGYILEIWEGLKDVNTTYEKVAPAANLLVAMRYVLTCNNFLSKEHVRPEYYDVCIRILDKFAFHPVPFLRRFANKELRKLRNIYVLRREDKQLEKQISQKAIEKLGHFVESGAATLKEMLDPWMDMLSMITSCGIAEIEMFCSKLVKRLFELPEIHEAVFEALNGLFASRLTDLPWTCLEVVTDQMYGVHAAYVESPAAASTRAVLKWLLVMQEAYMHAFRLYADETCRALPKIFRAVAAIETKQTEFEGLSPPAAQVPATEVPATDSPAWCDTTLADAIFETYRTLLEQIVGPVCQSEELTVQFAPQLGECFEVVASDLHATRHKGQYVYAIMIDSASQNGAELWMKCVDNFAILGEMGIGAAIRVLGPEMVLHKLPLKGTDGSLNLDRVFMLAQLKQNMRASSIQFFLDNISPLASDCLKLAEQDGPNCRTYNSAGCQLYELLPRFCAAAPDLEANFKHIAPLINDLIQNCDGLLRSAGLKALHACLLNATACKQPEVLDALRQFETNFLPFLYELYLTEPADDRAQSQRHSALQCLKLLVVMSKTALRKKTVLKAVDNLNVVSDDPKTAFVKRSIIQLFGELLPFLRCRVVRLIFAEYLQHLPKIQCEDEQKEAYLLLKRICSQTKKSSGSKKFVASNKKRLNSLLWQCLNRPFLFNDRRARFKLLVYLVMAQPHSNPRGILVGMVVREALSTLHVAKVAKEKNLACDALVCVFRGFQFYKEVNRFLAMIAFNLFLPEPDRDSLKAEILAVTCIYRNFSDKLRPKNVKLLIGAIIRAMNVPSVAVLSAGLTFLRVYFNVLPAAPTPDTLSTIFKILSEVPHKMKVFFRKQISIAFVALLNKSTFDDIVIHVQHDDLLFDLLCFAYEPPRYSLKIRATRDEFNHVTEPDEFLPKASRLEDILTDSDFSDDEACARSEVDFDESLRDSDTEDDDHSGLSVSPEHSETENGDAAKL